MADTGNLFGDTMMRSVICDTDLSAKQYYIVNFDTSDDNVVNLAAAALLMPFVLVEGKDGSTTAQAGVIAYGGRAKVILGGTVGAGIPIMADTAGKGVVATTGKYSVGITCKAGVAGDIVECIINPCVWSTVA